MKKSVFLFLVIFFFLFTTVTQASIIKIEKKYVEEIAPTYNPFVVPPDTIENVIVEFDVTEKDCDAYTKIMADLFEKCTIKAEVELLKKPDTNDKNNYHYRATMTGRHADVARFKKELEKKISNPDFCHSNLSLKKPLSNKGFKIIFFLLSYEGYNLFQNKLNGNVLY